MATSKRGKGEQGSDKKRGKSNATPGRGRTTAAAGGGRAGDRNRPRLKASHAEGRRAGRGRADAPGGRPGPTRRPVPEDEITLDATLPARDLALRTRAHGGLRKAPLTGPRRTLPRRTSSEEPSSATRELALAIAGSGIEKKAVGIEILDVSGKVDYADFLVIMTGRSDRHVHAIATGLEEAIRRTKKIAPLSIEGLTAATWVLIDFGDVVVHVFQEDARRLYDIEGLWIDANRVPVPSDLPAGATSSAEPIVT